MEEGSYSFVRLPGDLAEKDTPSDKKKTPRPLQGLRSLRGLHAVCIVCSINPLPSRRRKIMPEVEALSGELFSIIQ